MQMLENKVPPPIVGVVFAAAMWGLARFTPAIEVADYARIFAAALVAILGAGITVAGIISFDRAQTTVNPLKPDTASTLVISGIYQFTRNPMYLGMALLLVAWAVHLASPWALAGVAAFVVFMDRFQIQPEERALTRLFGEEFERYRGSVRRWL